MHVAYLNPCFYVCVCAQIIDWLSYVSFCLKDKPKQQQQALKMNRMNVNDNDNDYHHHHHPQFSLFFL